jgi:hypothetical protein
MTPDQHNLSEDDMVHAIIEPNILTLIALSLGGTVAVIGLIVWLTGLVLALRGSAPRDRPTIIRAYATCRPWMMGRRRN